MSNFCQHVFTKNVLAKNLTNFDPLSKNFHNRTDLSSSLNTKKTDGTMFGEPIRLSEPLQILSMFLAISQPVPGKHLQWKRGLNVAWDMNFSNSIGKPCYLKIYHLCRDDGRSKNLEVLKFHTVFLQLWTLKKRAPSNFAFQTC